MSNGQEKILNRRYRLDHQQGAGGMAVIYRATDLALGRQVAVKILRPSLTSDESFLIRFRQEARNVANLAHPNIVTVHDVGQDGNTHYIVMEYVDGQNLKDIIREMAPLSVQQVLDLAIQICAGIGYAHRAGLVHADAKPQNILVTAENTVKVTDFGIAQALAMTQPQERQKVVWGSPHYFSPEQAQGEYPTPASDVYSIGIVLFEMLTGSLPFTGNDQQELALAHIRDAPPRISEINPKVPTDLERIIQKALSKEPPGRYRTADQLGRFLIAYKEKGHEPTDQSAKPRPDAPPDQAAAQTQQRGSPQPQQPVNPSLATAEHRPISPDQPVGPRMEDPAEAKTLESFDPYAGQQGVEAVYPQNYEQGQYRQGYDYDDPYLPPEPDVMRSPGYRGGEPAALDMLTVVLAIVAFIAVTGVIILWIFVWQAYFG